MLVVLLLVVVILRVDLSIERLRHMLIVLLLAVVTLLLPVVAVAVVLLLAVWSRVPVVQMERVVVERVEWLRRVARQRVRRRSVAVLV